MHEKGRVKREMKDLEEIGEETELFHVKIKESFCWGIIIPKAQLGPRGELGLFRHDS
jgi:hypothetical protein